MVRVPGSRPSSRASRGRLARNSIRLNRGMAAVMVRHSHPSKDLLMSLDPATVRRIASLARIRLEEHEVLSLQADLNGILGWIEQLNEIDVNGIEPLAGGAQMALRLREDAVTDGGY